VNSAIRAGERATAEETGGGGYRFGGGSGEARRVGEGGGGGGGRVVELHRPAAREALALLHRRRPLLLRDLPVLLRFRVLEYRRGWEDGRAPTSQLATNTSGAVNFSDRSCVQSCIRVLTLFVLGLLSLDFAGKSWISMVILAGSGQTGPSMVILAKAASETSFSSDVGRVW
jgi:hypothetical protein